MKGIISDIYQNILQPSDDLELVSFYVISFIFYSWN